jgi:metal-responsive CopG/Arc/MetJ family transcriptional regulator
MMTKQKILTISLPKDLLKEIDTMRGDTPRSRFVSRMLEKSLNIPKEFQ